MMKKVPTWGWIIGGLALLSVTAKAANAAGRLSSQLAAGADLSTAGLAALFQAFIDSNGPWSITHASRASVANLAREALSQIGSLAASGVPGAIDAARVRLAEWFEEYDPDGILRSDGEGGFTGKGATGRW